MTKAFELYEQSALLGNSHGMYNLGRRYQRGKGVAKDVNKAKEWYTKAASTKAAAQLDKLNAE